MLKKLSTILSAKALRKAKLILILNLLMCFFNISTFLQTYNPMKYGSTQNKIPNAIVKINCTLLIVLNYTC